jgi:cation diffusion facilitator family transporter
MVAPLPAHHAATKDRAQLGARLVVRGMWLNAGLAIMKICGGVWGRSYALVADGMESLLDIAGSGLVWLGFHWAGQPPDREHPYGHGKADSLAAIFTALVIVGAGIGVGWHAVAEIRSPESAPRWETLLVLAVAIVLKFWFSRSLDHEGRGTASTALGAEAWHHFADAISSAAAFVGISVAVIGGPAFASADGWAALAASVVILWNGFRIFPRALNEVMDSAAPEELDRRVREIAAAVAGVEALDKSRTRKSGLSYLVDIQIRVNGDLTVTAGHAIAHAVKDALLGSDLGVTDVSVHVEPLK